MYNVKTEQRINIKFPVEFKKSETETFQMLTEAYGDETAPRVRVFEWRNVKGEDIVKYDERSVRQGTRLQTETLPKLAM